MHAMQRSPHTAPRRRAFTIVEILVVVALVLILLSIVIVAVNGAMRTAQNTNTRALMNSMSQAMVQFREDVGYLPPVLKPNRDIAWPEYGSGVNPLITSLNGPDPTSNQYRVAIQSWYSVTSLAEYLLGYGPEGEDGRDGLGIRHPGPDGYWGATAMHPGVSGAPGTMEYRRDFFNDDTSLSYRQGRSYGPYLQLRDDRLLGAINPNAEPDANGNFQVYFPGEAGYDPTWPKVIVDYWGEPIRYYRKPHMPGAITRNYRVIPNRPFVPPTLSDVFVLRPWDTNSGIEARFADENSAVDDRTSTSELQAADFAFFSSGADRRLNQNVRHDRVALGADTDELNRDNIVELGQ